MRVVLAALLFLVLPVGAGINHKIWWTSAEFVRLDLYARYEGVPIEFLIALRKAENGAPGQDYGQKSISREIKVLFPEKEWQMAQSARTLRRAIADFIREKPWTVVAYVTKFGKFDYRGYSLYFRSSLIQSMKVRSWAPEANPDRWAKNVLFLLNKTIKERK